MINLSSQNLNVKSETSGSITGGFSMSAVVGGGLPSSVFLTFGTRGQSQKSSLGRYTKSCNPPGETRNENRKKKHKKQLMARSLVGGRLDQCCRTPIPDRGQVDIWKRGEGFFYGGLMKCGSVWSCPVCASEITEVRRQELKQAIKNADKMGLHVSMLSLTVPHYMRDSLNDVLNGITGAFRKFTNRKTFKRVSEEIGLQGRIRTLEVTVGENGWHPHFHILLFTENYLDSEDLQNLNNRLLTHWQDACISSGLPLPNEHGLDLVNGSQAASYVSKWGLEEEMTKGHLKNGVKKGHVSPFGLLDLYSSGDLQAGERFKEFAATFKGKRQLVWSKGLRELLSLGKEKTDQEIADTIPEDSEHFVAIELHHWKLILKYEVRDYVLDICSQGKEAVQFYLENLHAYHKTWLKKL